MLRFQNRTLKLSGVFDLPISVNQVNKLIYPVISLNTTEEIDSFLDPKSHFYERSMFCSDKCEKYSKTKPILHKVTRVLLLTNNQTIENDMKAPFFNTAVDLIDRIDIRYILNFQICFVTNSLTNLYPNYDSDR